MVFLHHLTAVLDDWDPRVVDGIAAHHRVIAFDNRGVGATGGSVPPTVEQMGTDAIAFIRALGPRQGRSVRVFTRRRCRPDGGTASTGTGPSDDPGRHRPPRWRRYRQDGHHRRQRVCQGSAHSQRSHGTSCSFPAPPKARKPRRTTSGDSRNAPSTATRRSPTRPASPRSRPSDTPVRVSPTTSRLITHPVFVANGDHDLMVDSAHSADMARRLPNAQLKIYPNSGHGGVFQHHQTFVPDALQFLAN